MSDSAYISALKALKPVSSANIDVLAVVTKLAEQAKTQADPATRDLLLAAASDLLKASDKITGSLQQVSKF